MRFFFDRCVPNPIAQMVAAFEGTSLNVVPYINDSRFAPTTPDVDWMRVLRDDGDPLWIIVSGDGRILRSKVERAVLNDVGLPFFCLESPWPNTPGHEYAWRFMKVWPKIKSQKGVKPGAIFTVSAGKALSIDQIQ